jgi:hypothetical protein
VSGIAYSLSNLHGPTYYGAPSAFDPSQTKVPSTILLNDDGSYEFGFAAEAKYSEYKTSYDTCNLPGQLFQNLTKPMTTSHAPYDDLKAISELGKEHSLMDLIVKCLEALRTFAFLRASASWVHDLTAQSEIQWVITLPAKWNEFDKAFFGRAVYKAGLLFNKVMIISEPEAAALAVHVDVPHSQLLSAGNRFLVLNCEGQATDIFTYEVTSTSPPTLRNVAVPTGAAWGADSVNAEFEKFLRELLGAAFLPEYEGSHELNDVTREFDKARARFSLSRNPSGIRLIDMLENKRQLVSLAEAWNAKHPDRTVISCPTLRNGFLTMSRELMLSFFEPALSCIVDATKAALRNCSGIRHIAVVGDSAATLAVSERLTAEFHNENGMRVIIPDTREQIARGAVYFGVHKDLLAPG